MVLVLLKGRQIPICPEAVGFIALATGPPPGSWDKAVKATDNIATREDFKYMVWDMQIQPVVEDLAAQTNRKNDKIGKEDDIVKRILNSFEVEICLIYL